MCSSKEMDHGGLLNDDTVLRIVSELSWNERLKLKLVSQQFRRQVDKSLVGQRKLVVFHRLPIIADGQFKFSEEDYQANDCLYITDMKLFFESNLKNLQDLRKLIILSATPESCQLSFKLPKLEHLELYHLTITNCDLLSSPALTSFYNQDSVFKSCTPRFAAKRLENLSISSEYFVDVCQLLNEIDYLEIPENIEDLQLDPMLPLKARRIKINSDLKTAVDLLEKFECIERLDVNLTDSSLSPFAMPLMVEDLRELFKKNSKAPLFIFGAKVTRRNYHRLMDFLEGVVLPRLDIESNRVTLQIDCPLMLEDLEEEDEMFGAFYRVNEALVFEDLHLSNMLFNKLSNVRQITLCLTRAEWYHENDRSNQLLLYFPKLEALEIEVKPYVRLSNRFLDTIPVYCGNLVHLRVQCFDEVSFGFLSQLTKLKYLMITAYHSWRYRVVMRLLKQLKYLSYFRLSFLKPENGFAKEDLSEFKQKVNSMVEEELHYNDFTFKITLHHRTLRRTKNKVTVIKFHYERPGYLGKQFSYKDDEKDYEDLCSMIDLRSSSGGHSKASKTSKSSKSSSKAGEASKTEKASKSGESSKVGEASKTEKTGKTGVSSKKKSKKNKKKRH